MNAEQFRTQLEKLLENYQEIFRKEDETLGTSNIGQHNIKLTTDTPVTKPLYRLGIEIERKVEEK